MILRGTIVTCDQHHTIIPDGYLVIEDGQITAVGSTKKLNRASHAGHETLDFPHHWILPGFINGHTHSPTTLVRGLVDRGPITEWLAQMQKFEQHYDTSMIALAASIGMLEMISAGITTIGDMYFAPDTVARSAEAQGIRAMIGAHITNDQQWLEAQQFHQKWSDRSPRIITSYAPHAPYSIPMDLLKKITAQAATENVPLMMHLAEGRDELITITKLGFRSYRTFMAASGILDCHAICAHAIHLTPDDITALASSRISIVHCPISNAKLSSGIAPVREYLDHGYAVGLGTDGASSNNYLSILREMHVATLLQGVRTPPHMQLTPREIVHIATLHGARALHIDHLVGSLEVGKRADIAIIRNDRIHQFPAQDIFSTVAYATRDDDVEHVIIDGIWRKRNGQSTLPKEEIVQLLTAARATTNARLHLSGP